MCQGLVLAATGAAIAVDRCDLDESIRAADAVITYAMMIRRSAQAARAQRS